MARCSHACRVAQEALPDPGRERCAATPATPSGDDRRNAHPLAEARIGGDVGRGAVGSACEQWSIGRDVNGTLVRHDIYALAVRRRSVHSVLADAPAPRTCCVSHAAAAAALVAPSGVAACCAARLARTGSGAVALTAVALAADQDPVAAAGAQEHASGAVHTHLGPCRPKVLDGLVPARHTPVAPPSSARCRVRHGQHAAKRYRTAAAPDLLRHRRALYKTRLA